MKTILIFLLIIFYFSIFVSALDASGGMGVDLTVVDSVENNTNQTIDNSTIITPKIKHNLNTEKNSQIIILNLNESVQKENLAEKTISLTNNKKENNTLPIFLFANMIFSVVLLFLLFRVVNKKEID